MKRNFFILSLLLLSYSLIAQNQLPSDTLVAQVATKLNGATRDLGSLDIRLLSLKGISRMERSFPKPTNSSLSKKAG